ncbi:ribose/xylose/arabinose/galactoside ABC-type transport system permease subunit [Peribacillus frigoritolerans]
MIGGNKEAARLSGISVNTYLISALFAAIGGIVLALRGMTSEINSGSRY